MHQYIIMGPQGSGKGSQARLLSDRLSLVHISMGEILRWHLSAKTDLGVRIDESMSRGQLVDDEFVNEVLSDRFDQGDWRRGYILDGFPRTQGQAEYFVNRYPHDAVIVLHVADEVVIGRALNRRLCGECGEDFNLASRPPSVAGRCDRCGGELMIRDDDTPEAIRFRLAQYRDQTAPIIEVLGSKAPIVRIDASGTIGDGQLQIVRSLGLDPS